MNLNGKVIAITGAARGLGAEMAKTLATHGASIALIDYNQDNLSQFSKELSKQNLPHHCFNADISNEDQVIKVFSEIADHFGRLDGLINNAGIINDARTACLRDEKIKKMSLEAWQSVIDINLTGSFLCGREAIEKMIVFGKGGCIINISSICRVGNIGQANYSAAKAGVVALGECWAKENAAYNIRTASIAPGYIKTEMTQTVDEKILNRIVSKTPSARFGLPNEVAQAALYILQNDFVNGGTVLEVNGGMRI